MWSVLAQAYWITRYARISRNFTLGLYGLSLWQLPVTCLVAIPLLIFVQSDPGFELQTAVVGTAWVRLSIFCGTFEQHKLHYRITGCVGSFSYGFSKPYRRAVE
jgi:hypothetical protein